jgi:hypothetical protein
MDVLVIGATGFFGGAVARHLARRGRRVTGMARTPAAAELLRGQGLVPLLGNLDDGREPVLTAAARADAVVFAAQPDPHDEEGMVAQLLDALAGTGTTFLFTSGSGVLLQRTGGAWSEDCYSEDDPFPVEPLAARRSPPPAPPATSAKAWPPTCPRCSSTGEAVEPSAARGERGARPGPGMTSDPGPEEQSPLFWIAQPTPS